MPRQTLANFVAKQPKPKRTNKKPEQAFIRAAIDALNSRGVFAWRNQSGIIPAEYKGKKRFIHMGPTGSPDIIGILYGGVMFGIEGKAGDEKPTDKQLAFGELMKRHGAYWSPAWTIGEVISLVEQWQYEVDQRQSR